MNIQRLDLSSPKFVGVYNELSKESKEGFDDNAQACVQEQPDSGLHRDGKDSECSVPVPLESGSSCDEKRW